jgi:hypothetical protein
MSAPTPTPTPTPPPTPVPENATLERIRAFVLWILVIGLIGTGVELILLEHYEDAWQLVPLVMIPITLIVIGWLLIERKSRSIRAFQAMMWLFVVSGAVGVLLHYKGNVEFELEMYPSLGGLALFKEAMMGATPALAPGTMLQFGLLGLAYTFRHPALGASASRRSPTTRQER